MLAVKVPFPELIMSASLALNVLLANSFVAPKEIKLNSHATFETRDRQLMNHETQNHHFQQWIQV